MKNIALIGANSCIAQAYVAANEGMISRLALCARDGERLQVYAEDFQVRFPGVQIKIWVCDVTDTVKSAATWQDMSNYLGRIDEVVVAPGVLGDQKMMEQKPVLAYSLLQTNSAAVTYWVLLIAEYLRRQQSGVIGIITSVAGVRGRASNYIYGSSKAQLIVLVEGLRCSLAPDGVRVVDFRPGIVKTPMTVHLKRGLLMASATKVGTGLAKAMEAKGGVVYSPTYWRLIMLVIRHLPFVVFKKMRF